MTTLTTTLNPASIPIFDWNGPAFLVFYLAAFVGAMIWTSQRSERLAKRFEGAPNPRTLTDPFDIAFLAGGAPRVTQLAVARLLKLDLIVWRKRWTGEYLAATGKPTRESLHPVESALLTRVLGRREIGVAEACDCCRMRAEEIETRLAAAGLRPTAKEKSRTGWQAVRPLLLLMAVGGIKLAIGICRDKPVVFLAVGLFFTFIVTMAMMQTLLNRAGILTKAGREMLAGLRAERATASRESGFMPDLPLWSMGIALVGAYAITGIADADTIANSLNRHLSRPTNGGDTSGGSSCGTSGCSSGCGSGCGGGGCGGCGGGGD
ncbi:TIGR04222 domain-containing membrane protein [Luteolibacter ambystomatis]|uniref:TIGR04222 domain-containing membrane protein n=1 Tax=Luteolibacter ambystomatis TaxID=2824561 RepID=A0A975G785_9BACT|nr:TIGR04222 domain-containing membrane protein [Luteolibacter ambystomatis]QUE50051.1 TIGR04222 domain-containing membrane protein [Luteolibacter ambystomatis]